MSEELPEDKVNELALVSTEDLVKELFSRHDAVLIVREKSLHTNTKLEGSCEALYDYCGTVSTAIGLAERAKNFLLSNIS